MGASVEFGPPPAARHISLSIVTCRGLLLLKESEGTRETWTFAHGKVCDC